MSKYTEAVERELEGITYSGSGIAYTCPECQRAYNMEEAELEEAIENGDIVEEASFSWSACDACGSSLGGDRHTAHGFDREGNLYHLDICTDCLFYLEYGDEPENIEE